MTLIQALINCIDEYHKAEISELKSQVEDLNEELGNVLDVKNRQAWEIRLLQEDIKRLKRIKAEDRED